MIKEVIIGNKIKVKIRKSSRARLMRIAVYRDGRVLAVQPVRISFTHLLRFIESKIGWTEKKLKYFEKLAPIVHSVRYSKKEKICLKVEAKKLVLKKLKHFNQSYNFDYKKIFIRDQKTRWGSCSKGGNLNFNYKIAALPEKMADYIIVHELCHLAEFNHSKNFWDLVSKNMPDYLEIRKELRKLRVF